MTGAPVPAWECLFPGYMRWELDCLSGQARAVKVDSERLAQGILEVAFEWPLRGQWIPLRAHFQSTHPYVRPQVFLMTPPEQWPERHVAPDTGNICLLGRDSAQWQPEWSLAELLDRQLEGALFGVGDEDPQGEPAEVWWNQVGQTQLNASYCLFDSDWDLSGAMSGELELVVLFEPPAPRGAFPQGPRVRAYVRRVLDKAGATIAEWTEPFPAQLAHGRLIRAPWHRLDNVLLPHPGHGSAIGKLRTEHFGKPGHPETYPGDIQIRFFAFLYPIELDDTRKGDGWFIALEWGPRRAFRLAPGNAPKGAVVPTLRAGRSDMGVRVPAVATFRGCKVLVIGTGALGAPIAIGLARNGVQRLTLVDFDTVEPGNSVRWPLGAPAWGKSKVFSLKEHIENQFPGCTVDARSHALGIGGETSDDQLLAEALKDAALVIDASASYSVSRLIWDRSQRVRVPMLQLGATPEVRGGSVVHYPVGGPCIVCLEYARSAGTVDEEPQGAGSDARVQPVGCAERTFVGADYDLQELSLQAVRQAVSVVAGVLNTSVVDTLQLTGPDDCSSPPRWQRQDLPVHSGCSCQAIRDAQDRAPDPSSNAP